MTSPQCSFVGKSNIGCTGWCAPKGSNTGEPVIDLRRYFKAIVGVMLIVLKMLRQPISNSKARLFACQSFEKSRWIAKTKVKSHECAPASR